MAIRDDLLTWQWSDYAAKHRSRANLLIHIVAVPLFVAGLVFLVVGIGLADWLPVLVGLAGMLAGFAAQGLGHSHEPERPAPFRDPLDFISRFLAEQLVIFPRFVISGGWSANLRRRGPPTRTALAVLIAAASVLPIAPARADIVFCNEFGHVVNVAIAYPQADGTFISRGWLSLSPGDCAPFDTALRVKTFYFRGESERYRDANGKNSRYFWGKGRSFAMWERDNFQYYNAEERVLNSTLQEFTAGPEAESGDVSAKVTFSEGGSIITIGR
jgi:hypothetical protein